MKKNKKRLIPGIIGIALCIILLILAGAITSPVLRTIVTIAVIVGIIVALLVVLLVIFANKAGQESPAAPQASINKKSPLTPKQTDDLKKASSQLTRIRMTLSRFSDQKLAASGIEACDAIDKVLHTLKEKPEKIQTTRQLFNYYLPTMEQVVNRYQKLETSGVINPEIPANVQKYFDDIKEAMASQYEGLFDNDKLNVTVDMEAMTIALKRDGLLDEEDFKEAAPVKKAAEKSTAAGNTASANTAMGGSTGGANTTAAGSTVEAGNTVAAAGGTAGASVVAGSTAAVAGGTAGVASAAAGNPAATAGGTAGASVVAGSSAGTVAETFPSEKAVLEKASSQEGMEAGSTLQLP